MRHWLFRLKCELSWYYWCYLAKWVCLVIDHNWQDHNSNIDVVHVSCTRCGEVVYRTF